MRIITLKHGKGRYTDTCPFVVAEDLEISLDGIDAANAEIVTKVANNGWTESYSGKNFVIAKDKLTAGELNMSVGIYLHGELISSFIVEPLIIRDADLNVEPFTALITRQLQKLSDALNEYKARAQKEMQELAIAITNLQTEIEIIKAGADPLAI